MARKSKIPERGPDGRPKKDVEARGDYTPEEIEIRAMAQEAFKEDADKNQPWRKMAETCYSFASLNQWGDTDLRIIDEEERAAITYDGIGPVVDAIVGTEVQNRQQMVFMARDPRNDKAGKKADRATEGFRWAMDECNGDHERTELFRDAVVSGVGFGSVRMDLEDVADGRLCLDRVDPFDMGWDPYARKGNLEDANWFRHDKLVRVRDIVKQWPERAKMLGAEETRTGTPMAGTMTGLPGDEEKGDMKIAFYTPRSYQAGGQEVFGRRGVLELSGQGMERVARFQWREKRDFYRVVDPLSVTEEEATKPQLPQALAGIAQSLPPELMKSIPPDLMKGISGMLGGGAPPSAGGMGPPAGGPSQGGPPPGMPGMPPPGGAPPGAPPGMPPGGAPPMPGGMELPLPAPEGAPQPKVLTLTKEEFKRFEEDLRIRAEMEGREIGQLEVMLQQMWVYREAYLVRGVLMEHQDIEANEFTFKAVTHKWDRKQKMWYGVVRAMVDPQRGANKFTSAAIHQVSVAPKGTLLFEQGAFLDPEKARLNWARPGAPIQLRPGALSQKQVEVLPPAPFPEAMSTLVEYSQTALRNSTGVDLGTLTSQSMSAEAVKSGSIKSITVLAPLFDAYDRYRISEAKLVVKFLRLYVAEPGKMIRAGKPGASGEEKDEWVELDKESLADSYDVALDDAPRDPYQKQWVWELLQPLMPILMRDNKVPTALLDFFPAPQSVIRQVQQEMTAAQQAQAQAPPPPVNKQDHEGFIESEIKLNEANAALAQARAEALARASRVEAAEVIQDMVDQEGAMGAKKQRQGLGGAYDDAPADSEKSKVTALERRALRPNSPGVQSRSAGG
jgi:hypothetical protein